MNAPPVLFAIGSIGTGELLFLALIFFLLFGANKIPELARALGKAQREFHRARDEVEREVKTPPPETEEERVRRAARDLGIAVEGRSTEELRAAIARSMEAKGAIASTPSTHP